MSLMTIIQYNYYNYTINIMKLRELFNDFDHILLLIAQYFLYFFAVTILGVSYHNCSREMLL